MNITIRLATYADAADMANIHARSWEVAYRDIVPEEYIKAKSPTRESLWKRILSVENDKHFIILNSDIAVGMVTVGTPQQDNIQIKNDAGIDDSFWEVHGIYLHPDYYRLGIGTMAIDFAMNKARAAGKTNILLWVFEENQNAIRFYNKCGFWADGASKIYYCGKDMKCIRMVRKL